MEEFDQTYPGYGFAQHKGYGTGGHISCLQKLGPSPIHRLYFAPVRNIIASQNPPFVKRRVVVQTEFPLP
jgi:ribonuclease HII